MNREQKSLASASNRVLAATSSISNPSSLHFPIGKRVTFIKLSAMETSAPAATTFAAETIGLTKRYPLTWKRKLLVALDKLNLQVKPGEVFGLLGPNGSGKSTTLKLLLGLIVPSEGEARIFGMPPESLDARRRVGFLPENPYFYGFLTGDETLRFYGKTLRRDRRQAREAHRGTDRSRRPPERPRASAPLLLQGYAPAHRAGAGLIHDPDLLFLDEPTAGVDPLGSAQIRDLILRLKKMGKTVIFSSHLLEQVQEVADRVAIFSLGKKVLEGSLESLLTEGHSTQINIPAELSPDQQRAPSQSHDRRGGQRHRRRHPLHPAPSLARAALPAHRPAPGRVPFTRTPIPNDRLAFSDSYHWSQHALGIGAAEGA